MRAVSIQQPWAYAIAERGKRVENRTWKPQVPTQIALHASRGGDRKALKRDDAAELFGEDLSYRDLTRGAIFGVCQVRHVVSMRGELDVEQWKWWDDAPFGWILSDVRLLPRPIPCLGRLGLWPIQTGPLENLCDQLEEIKNPKYRLETGG